MNKPLRLRGAKGGSVPSNASLSYTSEDVFELNLGICEGPIAGLYAGPRSFYLGDTPLLDVNGDPNFDPFEVHVYHGADDASPVQNALGGTSSSLSVGVALDPDVPVVRSTDPGLRGQIDALEIRFLIANLSRIASDGAIEGTAADYDIEYRESGNAEWLPWFGEDGKNFHIGGYLTQTAKEIRRQVPRIAGDWEIRITRTTQESDGETREIAWESFQAINLEPATYNNTVILRGLGIAGRQLANVPEFSGVWAGLILKVPSNYDPVTRYYDGVWDGTFKDAYTDNPAWVLYNLLTNTVYGAKAYEPDIEVDRFSFYTAAQWCDELVPRGTTGTFQPRLTYNDLIQQKRQGLQVIRELAGIMGAILVEDQLGVIGLRLDRPAGLKQTFGIESVSAEGFQYSYSDVESRPNELKVVFTNPDLNWEDDERVVALDDYVARNGRTTKEFPAVGCIDSYEAERRAWQYAIAANTEITTVSFKTARQSMFLEPFDLIGISDPYQRWGLSGRVVSVAGATINLRDTLNLPVDLDLTLRVPTPTGVHTLTVRTATPVARELQITSGTWPADAPARAHFTLSESTNTIGLMKPFRVLTIREDENDPSIAQITALEVNLNKWSDAENLVASELSEYAGVAPTAVQPTNIRVTSSAENILEHQDGTRERRMRVTYDAPANHNVYVVYQETGDDTPQRVKGGSKGAYIRNVSAGDVYAMYLEGDDGAGNEFRPTNVFTHTVSTLLPPLPSTDLVIGPTTVQDESGTDRRPGIALVWNAVGLPPRVKNLQYEVNGQSYVVPVAGGFFVHTDGLLPATEYTVRATYQTTIGTESNWSAPAVVTTDNVLLTPADFDPSVLSAGFEVPDVPTGVTLTSELMDDGRAWVTAAWDAVDPVSGYEIEAAEVGENYVGFATTTTTYNFNVLPGMELRIRIRAVNGPHRSDWTPSQTITAAADSVPPAAPTGLEATPSFNAVWLKWDDNTEGDLARYEICEKDGIATPGVNPTSPVYSSTANTFVRSGLDDDTTKHYWVRAVDTSGNRSDWSSRAEATTPGGVAVDQGALQGLVDQTSLAANLTLIEIVSELPTEGNFEGRVVVYQGKVYRFRAGDWTAKVEAEDIGGAISSEQIAGLASDKITGQVQAVQLAPQIIDASKLAPNLSGIEIVSALPTNGNYVGRTVFYTFDQKLYRYTSNGWDRKVRSSDIDGTILNYQIDSIQAAKIAGNIVGDQIAAGAINASKFASGLSPIEILASLPTTGNSVGRVVFSQGQLHRYTSEGWTTAVPAGDLTGQITETQIGPNSISTGKIQSNAVEADQLAANSVIAGKIAAAAVSTTQLAAEAVTAAKMLIADMTNIVPNGQFNEAPSDYFEVVSGGASGEIKDLAASDHAGRGKWVLNLQKPSDSLGVSLQAEMPKQIPVIPGERLHAWVRIRTNQSSTNGGAYVRIRWFDADGNYDSYDDIANNVDITTAWVTHQLEVVVPAAARSFTIRLYNHSSQTSISNCFFDALSVRRMTEGELIVDGAITADKILAKTITGNEIAGETITAANLVVADTSNLVIDNGLHEPDLWNLGTSWFVAESAGYASKRQVRSDVDDSGGTANGFYSHVRTPLSPVEANQDYRFTVSLATAPSSNMRGEISVRVAWYTRDDNSISEETIHTTTYEGSPVTVSEILTAPFGAASASIRVRRQRDGSGRVSGAVTTYNFSARAAANVTMIKDGAITTGKIATDAVIADHIEVGAINAGHIQARAVTAEKLTLTDLTNAIDNPTFETGTADGWASIDSFFISSSAPRSGQYHLRRDATGSAAARNGHRMTVSPGEQVRVACYVRWVTAGTVVSAGARVVWLDENENELGNNGGVVPDSELSGNWALSSTIATAPANARFARFEYVAYGQDSGTLAFDDGFMNRANAAELIVDGSIKAQHLDVGSITAEKIAADAITSQNILIGDFTNLIPGADFEDDRVHPFPLTQGMYYSSVAVSGSERSLAIAHDSETTVFPQQIQVQPGEVIYYEFWARCSTSWNGAGHHLRIDAGDGTNLHAASFGRDDFNSANTWQKFSGTITTPSNVTRLIVSLFCNASASGGIVYLDNMLMRRAMQGELIVDGAITAGKIGADEIDTIHLAAGAVRAQQIAADAISVKHLAVSDFANLVPNGDFADQDTPLDEYFSLFGDSDASTNYLFSSSYLQTGPCSMNLQKPSDDRSVSIFVNSKTFAVIAGEPYYFETAFKTNQSATSAGAYYRVFWLDDDDNEVDNDDVASNVPISTTWVKHSAEFTAPAGAVKAYVRVFNHSSQTTTANLFIDRMVARRMNNAEMIVDGSIGAQKIDVEDLVVTGLATVNTAYIKDANISGQLNASRIAAGTTLSGQVIVNNSALNEVVAGANSPTLVYQFSDDEIDKWQEPGSNVLTQSGLTNLDRAGNISSSEANPASSGETGGVRRAIPAATMQSFAGKRVRVSLMARQPNGGNASAEFAVALSTDSVGNSGWQRFTPAAFWQSFAFHFDVPADTAVQGWVGIWADTSGSGREVVVDSVAIELSSEDWASDPAARINAKSTQIDPGLITVSGGTTLLDWRKDGDETRIDGGSISANTITANKLTIGNRGVNLLGCEFEVNTPVTNQVSWEAGTISYVGDNGEEQSRAISAGATYTWSSGTIYIYYIKNESQFRAAGSINTASGDDRVIIATYSGGVRLNANYGRTIIENGMIKTGTIRSDRIEAGTIEGDRIAGETITGDLIAATTVHASRIKLQDNENLWIDGAFEGRDESIFTRGGHSSGSHYFSTVASGGRTSLALRKTDLNNQQVWMRLKTDYAVSVRPGETFWAKCFARGNVATSEGFYYRIRWLDSDKNDLAYTDVVGNADLSNYFRTYEQEVTAPSNARFAVWQFYNNNQNTTAEIVYINDVVLRRKNGAELIVNGTITADHLDTVSLSVEGLALFGGALQSNDFVSGSAGWQIGAGGSAEFNDLIVRSSLQNNAVTDGVVLTDAGGAHDPYYVLMEHTLGRAVTMSDVWIIAVTADLRRRYTTINNTLQVRFAVMQGGSWSSWSELYQVARDYDDLDPEWLNVSNSGMFAFEGQDLRVQVRCISGDDNTQGFRNSSLFFKSIQR